MTHRSAARLALKVLGPFLECSAYEDYQREDGWSDEEYAEMLALLAEIAGGAVAVGSPDGGDGDGSDDDDSEYGGEG